MNMDGDLPEATVGAASFLWTVAAAFARGRQENEASGGPMITVRINEKAGGVTNRRGPSGKLRLLETNAGIFHEIVPQILLHELMRQS